MTLAQNIKLAFADIWKFLSFRFTTEDYERLNWIHFCIGFLSTWMVGIARNWDYPTATIFAKLGLASLAYIFFMALFLFLFAWPPSTKKQSYFKVLTVVAMTAPPGLIYGIPVEQMMALEDAQAMNLGFLFLVALWRVSLVFHFFRVGCQNRPGLSFSILLIPILLLIIALVQTGRAGYVLQLMGGLRSQEPSALDHVNDIVAVLYILSWPIFIFSAGLYFIESLITSRARKKNL